MSIEIKSEHLRAIADGPWSRDEDGDWSCPGEAADGVPDWDVLAYPHGLTLCAEWGVYGQRWEEVSDPADLARYARALEAAHNALERSLRESER